MTHAVTAIDAFERYQLFLAEDRLTQGAFHRTEKDGRQLACAMGVVGDDVDNTHKCPAEVMPRWLAQLVPFFFDRQNFADADADADAYALKIQRPAAVKMLADGMVNCLARVKIGATAGPAGS